MAFQNTAFQATAWMLAGTVAVPAFAHAQTTTNYSFARNLYYQAKIAPPAQPPQIVAPTTMDWQQPLSRAVPPTKLCVSNVIQTLAPPLEQFSLFDVSSTRLTVKVLHYQDKFEAIAVTAAADNNIIGQGWQQPLSTPQTKRTLYYQSSVSVIAVEAEAAEAATPIGVSIGGPSVLFKRTLQYKALTWVPPAPAAVDNNVTGTGYLSPLARAAKKTWPPLSAADLRQFSVPGERLGVEWLTPFGRATELPSRPYQQPPFVYAPTVVSNLTTTLEWMQAWRCPPSYSPPATAAQPFVPKEAVLENTVTPDKWLKPLGVAAKRPPVWATQPFFGYPYVAASNLTTTLEWLPRWPVPPNYSPPTISASPFVPKEAVLENTVTPDKWLFRWAQAVPVPKPVPTQPVLGYPYVAAANLTTTLEWLPRWPIPPSYQPPTIAAQPFVPRAAVLENTVTPDKWLQRWQGPPRYRPIKVQTPPFVPKAAIVDRQTPDKWMRPLADAAPRPPVWVTQPTWLPAPPPTEPEEFSVFSTTTTLVSVRVLHYESTFVPSYPYLTEPEDAGPADEHERVACVPLASRVVVVPELSRVVDTPFTERDLDSNEYLDRSCGMPETPVAVEPEEPTDEDGAFQDDSFQDDGFQI